MVLFLTYVLTECSKGAEAEIQQTKYENFYNQDQTQLQRVHSYSWDELVALDHYDVDSDILYLLMFKANRDEQHVLFQLYFE